MLLTLLEADCTRGMALAPSDIFSLVTSMDNIFPVFTLTAIWNLMNPGGSMENCVKGGGRRGIRYG